METFLFVAANNNNVSPYQHLMTVCCVFEHRNEHREIEEAFKRTISKWNRCSHTQNINWIWWRAANRKNWKTSLCTSFTRKIAPFYWNAKARESKTCRLYVAYVYSMCHSKPFHGGWCMLMYVSTNNSKTFNHSMMKTIAIVCGQRFRIGQTIRSVDRLESPSATKRIGKYINIETTTTDLWICSFSASTINAE